MCSCLCAFSCAASSSRLGVVLGDEVILTSSWEGRAKGWKSKSRGLDHRLQPQTLKLAASSRLPAPCSQLSLENPTPYPRIRQHAQQRKQHEHGRIREDRRPDVSRPACHGDVIHLSYTSLHPGAARGQLARHWMPILRPLATSLSKQCVQEATHQSLAVARLSPIHL